MDYIFHVGSLILIYLVLVQAMNIYLGYTGILALSHIAFYGIGAYAGALMSIHFGSIWLGFLLGAAISLVLGILVGLTSIKLRADYLGIATLGFAQIVSTYFQTANNVTRGPLGLVVPKPNIFGWTVNTKMEFFILILIVSIILMFVMYRMVKSPFGRVLETIRDDEVATKSLGKNTTLYKLIVFSIGSIAAALIGVLYAHFIAFINPMSFHVNELSLVLVMTMLGGLGTFRGPFFGVVIITFLSQGIKFLKDVDFINIPVQYIGGIELLMFNLLFLIIIIYLPQGVGGFTKFKKRRRKQFTSY